MTERSSSTFAALLCVLLAAGAAAQQQPIPQGRFICHAITGEGSEGLVFVLADSEERAEVAARAGRAMLPSERFEPVLDVVECVAQTDGRFRSSAMNELMKSLAR
jgi:hypothetical protein